MKISIIVPVYNSEKYLEKCISSLIYQTYKNLEIILVNDGSTDKSKDVINKFFKKDSRIKVINKKNSGVSDTRNIGINASSGDYLLFVDSDDYIDPEYVEKSVQYIELNNLDYLKCSYIELVGSIENRISYYNSRIFTKEEIIHEISISDNFSSIGGVFVNKNIIINNNIVFNNKYKHGEDLLFNYNCIIKSNKVGYLNKCNYYYVKNNDSVSNSIKIENVYKYADDNLSVINKLNKIDSTYKSNKLLKKLNLVAKKCVFNCKVNYKEYKKFLKYIYTNEKFACLLYNVNFKKIVDNRYNIINMKFLNTKHFFLSYIYLKICLMFKDR